ncbi:MAG: hypothetical protein ICV76_00385, partial [Nitrospiraceae bacterium]|nr:hypothetical protein [Nitrospiraceae bacterium]
MFITIAILVMTVTLTSTGLAQTPTVEAHWKAFRETYPYHVQGIAMSPTNKRSRTLIIAEPPPHVTIESLKAVDPTVFASPQVKQHPIGYDGWVKDVVVHIDKIGPQRLTALIDKLHVHLFGTAYKAYVLKIPERSPGTKNEALDLQINAADLNRWLFQAEERFSPLHGGPSQPIAAVLKGPSGVYYSDTPGLVALVVPKALPLGAMRRELRQFALDSDLILGATDSPSHLGIIARERVVNPDALPPLRAESILLLAAAKSSELAQSYERTNFFAGRMIIRPRSIGPQFT